MVSIGEIRELNILSKLQGILYGPTAIPFLTWAMMHSISGESVGERKNDASSFLPRLVKWIFFVLGISE